MKLTKIFLLGVAAFIMASLASCSNDEVTTPDSREGHLCLTINLPSDFTTRSFGDATNSTILNFAIFDVSGQSPVFVGDGTADFQDGQTSTIVDFNLVTGKEYKIVMFAQSEASMGSAENNAAYAFESSTATVTVNYDNMTSENNNADAYDCFSAVYNTGTITSGNASVSVNMTRPVAQVNWGTDDLSEVTDAYGNNGEFLQSTLTFTPYISINLLSGALTANETPVTLPAFGIPEDESYPIDGYQYIAMQYILVPVNSTPIDLTLTVSSQQDSSVSKEIIMQAVPLQANYQTNIYGSLLTSTPTD